VNFALDVLAAVLPAVFAITLHEAAHGYAAWALGDDTAKRMGRLSLNPIRHVDPVGTIALPGFLLLSQLLTIGRVEFMFGWAKPVPVAAWKFPNPLRGMMWVAAAGPAMNVLLAWLGALAFHLFPVHPGASFDVIAVFLVRWIEFNLILALFNLIPIPPLDGGRILTGLLPLPLAERFARMERAGIAVVLLGFFLLPMLLREAGFDADPLGWFLRATLRPAAQAVLWLAGHDIGG
jgi:Zn-dependent protease